MFKKINNNLFAFYKRKKAIIFADSVRDIPDPEKASRLYREIIEKWGETYGLLLQLGNALKDSGSYDAARDVYLKALRKRPEHEDIYLQLGHLFKLRKDNDTALSWYIKCAKINPNYQDVDKEILKLNRRDKRLKLVKEPLKLIYNEGSFVNIEKALQKINDYDIDLSFPSTSTYKNIYLAFKFRRI